MQVGSVPFCDAHAAPMVAFVKFDTIEAASSIECSENANHLQAKMF